MALPAFRGLVLKGLEAGWARPALARSGLLDLRLGRRAAAAVRAVADAARRSAAGRPVLVALHGPRALGLAARGSPYDLAVVVEGGPPTPGYGDEVGDACLGAVIEGLLIRTQVLSAPAPGVPPDGPLGRVLRDGIAVVPRGDGAA